MRRRDDDHHSMNILDATGYRPGMVIDVSGERWMAGRITGTRPATVELLRLTWWRHWRHAMQYRAHRAWRAVRGTWRGLFDWIEGEDDDA